MRQLMKGLRVIPGPTKGNTKYNGHVLVGVVMEMVRYRSIDSGNIEVLVLDEADSMLDQHVLGEKCTHVKSLLPKSVQIVLFSATFPAHVLEYTERFAPNHNTMTLKADGWWWRERGYKYSAKIQVVGWRKV
jgi:ATP-dependent RNA helicase DDX19/DBP5